MGALGIPGISHVEVRVQRVQGMLRWKWNFWENGNVVVEVGIQGTPGITEILKRS